MYLRRQFLHKIGQTSPMPQMFEVAYAKGSYLYDNQNNAYLDLVSGFGVNNIGHGNTQVLEAVRHQSQKFMHTSVYGEHVQQVQVAYAELICQHLPAHLQQVYFLSSGSECIDGCIKLARAYTGRTEIVVCKNAYHGSSIGAESVRSDFSHKKKFFPLLPGIHFIEFNNIDDLNKINDQTALVLTEVVQAEAGVNIPSSSWLEALRNKCDANSCLLAFDEIQTGLGRTGNLFAFQHYGISPDLLLLGKALGGGLPLSAIISSKEIMFAIGLGNALSYISTFGGNPVSCAAGMSAFKYLTEGNWHEKAKARGNSLAQIFLSNGPFTNVRQIGLMLALDLPHEKMLWPIIQALYDQKYLVEGFLFNPMSLRIAPPLNTPEEILLEAAETIKKLVNEMKHI